ncbi:MAG TPA: hypothetical protein VGY53_02100, partial [Isosphaeraceae bacterium]|nr:hypothetical protein [Isosphaeraceae bacterium]
MAENTLITLYRRLVGSPSLDRMEPYGSGWNEDMEESNTREGNGEAMNPGSEADGRGHGSAGAGAVRSRSGRAQE